MKFTLAWLKERLNTDATLAAISDAPSPPLPRKRGRGRAGADRKVVP